MEKISIKNVGRWLSEQMSHPMTLFQRKSWGVFSPYAHFRRSDHRPKQTYKTKDKALSVAEEMGQKYGGAYSVYKCVYCDGWHVAKDGGQQSVQAPRPIAIEGVRPTSKTLDVEKILATDIPDIHPVYGGVRGRTLSSVKQAYAWPVVKEAGIHTIIDLRADGIYSRLQQFCDKYGMRYYYYPVDKQATLVEKMIEHFSEFCRLIDEGNFYIACAQGLHRTDIALCAYWVFYAADKGIAPPDIRGYLQEEGHDTSKIMRVLNAFYKRLTEINDKEPIPMKIFVERKQIIKQLSRKQTKTESSGPRKRIYVEMDGCLADTSSGYAKLNEEVKKEYAGRFNEVPGVVLRMDPVAGAIESIRKLQEDDRFDVFIITTPLWNTPSTYSDKLKWIQHHLGTDFVSRMIFTAHKELLRGDYLIDCRSKDGTKAFEGEWILFGKTDFPDWQSVLKHLGME